MHDEVKMSCELSLSDHIQQILELLVDTWQIDQIESIVRCYHPQYSDEKIEDISQQLAELHCSGNGYSVDDMEKILRDV